MRPRGLVKQLFFFAGAGAEAPQLGAPAFEAGRAVAKRRRERRAKLRRHPPGQTSSPQRPFTAV